MWPSRSCDNVLPLAHGEIARYGHQISGEVDEQYSTKADVVVHKAYNCARDQPPSLHSRQQKRVGLNKFSFWRKFLNERGDSWPEHPEASSYQHVHQVKLPDVHASQKCEH